MAKPLYKEADLRKKVEKLAGLFPHIGWADLHELTPQIMEIVECAGIIREATGEDKKVTTLALFDLLLDQVESIDGIRESVPGLIDVICNASKGKYAINKENKESTYEEVA